MKENGAISESNTFDNRGLEAKITRMVPSAMKKQKQIGAGANEITPLLTKHQPFEPVRVEDYLEQIDQAFDKRNRFYDNFIKQDMKELDRELFPPEVVHSADIKPVFEQRSF